MTEPLVPANLDLGDFLFMPFEFDRLFQSETWVLSNDAEKVAALTLWGKAWREVPAGSLPNNDRMLAHLSGAGTRWKRLKPMALRGWVDGGDGRLYHPVVCEKALEAWIEKLTSRVVGGVGNATRWGNDFDPESLIAEIATARGMLKALNPDSRTLRKPIPKGQKKNPGGNPNGTPGTIPMGSQGTGTGTVRATAGTTHTTVARDDAEPPTTPPGVCTPAGLAAAALNRAGVRVTSQHPNLIAAMTEGVTTAALLELHRVYPDKPAAYLIATARRQRAEIAAPIPPGASHAASHPGRRLSAVERVQANIAAARRERGELPDHDGNVLEGTAVRVAD